MTKAHLSTAIFLRLLAERKLPAPVAEYQFAKPRKWRLDFAWVEQRVALEVDGSIWTGGRHTRGSGWLKDTEKINEAVCLGWRMLRCCPQTLHSKETLDFLKRAINYKP